MDTRYIVGDGVFGTCHGCDAIANETAGAASSGLENTKEAHEVMEEKNARNYHEKQYRDDKELIAKHALWSQL